MSWIQPGTLIRMLPADRSNTMTLSIRLLFGISILCIVDNINAYTTTYAFKNHCSYNNHKLDDDDTYYVTYDGETLPSSTCSIGFYGGGSEVFDEYKVCVETETFKISNCNIKLIYSEHIFTDDETYSCGDYPKTFCVPDGEFLHIDIKNANRYTDANFKLRMYAIKTYDYHKTVGIIVGSVVGGLVLCSVIFITVVVCICRRNRRNNAGTVLTQNNPQGYPSVQYAATTYPSAPPQPPTTQGMVYNTNQQYGVGQASYSTPSGP